MVKVSEIKTVEPEKYENEIQKLAYKVLKELDIKYERVDNTPAITMEDCIEIDKKLNVKTVKTLFLNNRQETIFYMFITPGDKKFDCKNFGKALNISRVSFAKEETVFDMLGTKIGATTIFSILNDLDLKINLVIDSDVLKEEYYGCSDATFTSYMKIKMKDLVEKLIPYSKHKMKVISI
jgi:hypothetical protein